MSDDMTKAVIGMPYELAMANDLSLRQFYARAQTLLNEVETLRQNNERYQWIQRHCDIDYRGHRPDGDYASTDESIDAAMKHQEQS